MKKIFLIALSLTLFLSVAHTVSATVNTYTASNTGVTCTDGYTNCGVGYTVSADMETGTTGGTVISPSSVSLPSSSGYSVRVGSNSWNVSCSTTATGCSGTIFGHSFSVYSGGDLTGVSAVTSPVGGSAGSITTNGGTGLVTGSYAYTMCSNSAPNGKTYTPSGDGVCTPVASCSITSFTADSSTLSYNTGTTLRFALSGSYSWSIAPLSGQPNSSPSSGTGSSGTSGTGNLTIVGSNTYRLTCGTATRDVTVSVGTPLIPSCSPVSQTVNTGVNASFTGTSPQGSYLWSATGGNPTSGTASTFSTKYSSAGTYSVQLYDGIGQSSNICSVTVNATPDPTATLTASGGGYTNATNLTVPVGTSLTYNWTSSNADTYSSTYSTPSCGSGSWVANTANGSSVGTTVSSQVSCGTYTLTHVAKNSSTSKSATASIGVTVVAPSAISVTLTANPTSMNLPSNSTTLTWTTSGSPDSCTASNYWSGSKSTSGGSELRTGMTAGTYTYTITCSKAGASSVSSTAVVTVKTAVPVVTLTASPSTGASPLSTTLTWSSTGSPTSCTASGGWSGTKAASGSQTITGLTTPTTFTLTCTNAGGNGSKSVTVTPTASLAPVLTFTANPTTGPASSGTLLLWSATNGPVSCTASASPFNSSWNGSQASLPAGNTGSQVISPINVTTTFTQTCSNAYGSDTKSVTFTPSVAVPVVTLTVSPSTGASPLSTTLTWSSTGSPTSCTASGGWSGTKAASGSQTITGLTTPTTFTLTCTNAGGNGSQSVTVTPVSGSIPVVTISASPSTGASPLSTTLTWSSTGSPTSCTASGGWSGTKAASGSQTITGLTTPTTFTLTCTNVLGSGSNSILVTPLSSYSVTVNVSQGGVVKSTDGKLDCGVVCSQIYNTGDTVTLVPYTQSTSWKFVGWTGDCLGKQLGADNHCTLVIDGTKNTSAIFTPRPIYIEF